MQLSGLLEKLDGRGQDTQAKAKVDAMEQKIHDFTPPLKPTVGPTAYQEDKAKKEAQDDGWE